MIIRRTNLEDVKQILEVYKSSSHIYPESLTQYEDELNLDYIKNEINNAINRGIILVAENQDKKIIGSFKAYTSKYRKLAHIMTNATFVTMPTQEGKKAFVLLLKAFLNELKNNYKHIYKLEGVPHESNKRLVSYYLKNSFIIEGEIKDKINNFSKKQFENEIIISWLNPNFDKKYLEKYCKTLKDII